MNRVACLLAVLALAGCQRGADLHNVRQTKAPGHVTSGGRTSGEVIATSPQPQQPASSGPAGTPGIPQGSGGNTGGVAVGGAQDTVQGQQQGVPAAPAPVHSEKAGTAPASGDAKTDSKLSPPGVRSDAPPKAGN